MADTTIPQLPAISSLLPTALFPVDSGSQTFKATLSQIKSGMRGSLAKTANYSVAASDDFLFGDASGGAFTFTMTAAASLPRVEYQFTKTDSSTNAITITDGTFSTTLNTQGESVRVFGNATSFFLLNRYIPSVWTAFTPGFNLTTNVGTKSGFWKRVGDNAQLQFQVAFTGTNGQALAPTFTLPTGLTIATAKIATVTGSYTSLLNSSYFVGNSVTVTLAATYSSTTQIAFNKVVSTTGTNQNIYQLGVTGSDLATANGNLLFCSIIIPITGWNG